MVDEEAASQRHNFRKGLPIVCGKRFVRVIRKGGGELQLEAEMILGSRVVGGQIEAGAPVVGHRAVASILHENALLTGKYRLVGRCQNTIVAAGAEEHARIIDGQFLAGAPMTVAQVLLDGTQSLVDERAIAGNLDMGECLDLLVGEFVQVKTGKEPSEGGPGLIGLAHFLSHRALKDNKVGLIHRATP